LLVVITIIGILVALLLPAVQAAREAARRMQCTNNLKQIGLALHNYHEAQNTLPFASGYNAAVTGTWAAFILPNLEQQGVFDLFNFRYSMGDAANERAVATTIPAFACPSDPAASRPIMENRTPGTTSAGGSNPIRAMGLWYPACTGPTTPDFCTSFCYNSTPGPNNPCCQGCNWGTSTGGFCVAAGLKGEACFAGMFGRSTAGVSFNRVTDGLSNTLMVGESLPGHNVYNCAYCPNFPVATTHVPLNLMETMDDTTIAQPAIRTAGFKSMHPGGVNFAVADGSVHFMNETTDYLLVNRLGTRAGGEAVMVP
jgi:type II secretory pathway pseudopilin PulG